MDFKKLRRQMLEDRGVPQAEIDRKLRAQTVHNQRHTAEHATQPVLETALHREMTDPQYLASLELFVDTRS